ncbi:MAG: rod-binding protein [Rhodobacteraceae bacterium]|nr:rod-binding protein [Paracoccaceae bacterium]
MERAADGRQADRAEALRAAARQLEAAFVAEMLKAGGIGEARAEFGGGEGEAQFASMLRDELAGAIAGRDGLGLADSLFQTMARRYGSGG